MGKHGAGHARAFDDMAAWLAEHTSKTAVVELLRVAWATVGAIVNRVVAEYRAARDQFDGLVRVGLDEISATSSARARTCTPCAGIWPTPVTRSTGRDELGGPPGARRHRGHPPAPTAHHSPDALHNGQGTPTGPCCSPT